MARRVRFTAAYTVNVRNARGNLIALVEYPEGFEGLIPQDHFEKASAAGAVDGTGDGEGHR